MAPLLLMMDQVGIMAGWREVKWRGFRISCHVFGPKGRFIGTINAVEGTGMEGAKVGVAA